MQNMRYLHQKEKTLLFTGIRRGELIGLTWDALESSKREAAENSQKKLSLEQPSG